MKIKIEIHSIIDVITNSSSEIFTIETGKTKEFLSDSINEFCRSKKIKYSIPPSCIDVLEEFDWDIKYKIQELRDLGYTVERKSPNQVYCISIDRDDIYNWLEPLKDFLITTFNAKVEND